MRSSQKRTEKEILIANICNSQQPVQDRTHKEDEAQIDDRKQSSLIESFLKFLQSIPEKPFNKIRA